MVKFSLRKVFAAMIDDKSEISGEPALDIKTEEESIPLHRESSAAEPEQFESDLDIEDEDLSDDDHAETINSEGDFEVIDDPMAGAFDLDGGDRFDSYDGDSDGIPFKTKVESPKEFFSAEVLYRFDIIPPEELTPIKGDYRIELKGTDGGVWSIKVGDTLEVNNVWQEADTVLIMQQRDFMEIVNGTLNPQLALLSKKVEVKGDTQRAIKIQDLLAPKVD